MTVGKALNYYSEYLTSGIYCLFNLHNNKYYIGSSNKISKRIWEHFYSLENGQHYNSHLQKSYNKYPEKFTAFVLEDVCDLSILLEREQFWIDKLEAYDPQKGYNISPSVNGTQGYRHTNEAKIKMSIAKLGKNHHNYGKALSESTKKRIGDGNRGKVRTDEHKQKLREINLGKTLSEEVKSKISESGKKRFRSKDELDRVAKMNSKKVYQYATDLSLINVFESCAEAERELGYKRQFIYRVCRGIRNTYKGFIWSYTPLNNK